MTEENNRNKRIWSIIFNEINASVYISDTERLCRVVNSITDVIERYIEENYIRKVSNDRTS